MFAGVSVKLPFILISLIDEKIYIGGQSPQWGPGEKPLVRGEAKPPGADELLSNETNILQ